MQTLIWGGQIVDATSVLVRFTYDGDLNLDGLIDAQDYGVIDNWVQFPGAGGYANGDINYDGVIDAQDYGIIDNNIQVQGAPLPLNTAPESLVTVTAVPEPSACGFAILTAAAMLTRRRRCNRA
jgi:hypothetical protein